MASATRTIGHEDRLSLVDHLDELRNRLIICAVALALAFGLCLWQNHALLNILNKPLHAQTAKRTRSGKGTVGQAYLAGQGVLAVAADARLGFAALVHDPALSASTRAALARQEAQLTRDVARIPRTATGDNPVTLGVGEPFTTTITITLYFALIFALPVILFELYSFVLPAFSPNERRIALPLMSAIPFLFVGGVLFGYFVVLPAAVRFFQNFNSSEFNVLVQASPYYKFAAITLLAMGLVFQVPVGILAATRAGIVTPAQLRKNRRYAVVACASVAAFLPGDAITLLLETVPLYLLFEASILLASVMSRRDAARALTEATAAQAQAAAEAEAEAEAQTEATASQANPDPAAGQSPGPGPEDPEVRRIIDHTDEHLSE